MYCGKTIYYNNPTGNGFIDLGICGHEYRRCDDPEKKSVHIYGGTVLYDLDSFGKYGAYVSGLHTSSFTGHDEGTTSPPSVSVNGPNGVGLDKDDYDKSPNCDKCLDSSQYCPDASTKH